MALKVYCKKHRKTLIKFVKSEDGLDGQYYCPKCDKERKTC